MTDDDQIEIMGGRVGKKREKERDIHRSQSCSLPLSLMIVELGGGGREGREEGLRIHEITRRQIGLPLLFLLILLFLLLLFLLIPLCARGAVFFYFLVLAVSNCMQVQVRKCRRLI